MREAANLPERTTDTRVVNPQREKQKNQNEPPAVSPEENMEEETGEIPEEKVKAAKKRLGRSG